MRPKCGTVSRTPKISWLFSIHLSVLVVLLSLEHRGHALHHAFPPIYIPPSRFESSKKPPNFSQWRPELTPTCASNVATAASVERIHNPQETHQRIISCILCQEEMIPTSARIEVPRQDDLKGWDRLHNISFLAAKTLPGLRLEEWESRLYKVQRDREEKTRENHA